MNCCSLGFLISRRIPLINFSMVERILLVWFLLATMGVMAHAQDAKKPCNVSGFARQTWKETEQFGDGLKSVPRAAIRPENLMGTAGPGCDRCDDRQS
jgi:hypothetical protein